MLKKTTSFIPAKPKFSTNFDGQLDPNLNETLIKEQNYLAETNLPIITVSASYKEDLKGLHGLEETDIATDIVFSRAHCSMTIGIAVQAWGKVITPQKAWPVDPTNYVSDHSLRNIKLTQFLGELLARQAFLKKLKDWIDQFGRQKYPIADSITPAALFLTAKIKRPILSLHIAVGNILLEKGHQIIQVVTDPHVREDYLKNIENPNLKLCVFDQKTKTDFLEKIELQGKKIDEKKIIITGPPIDPRIIKARKNKVAWRSGPLRLCLATGGLGTNKNEIKQILTQILPVIANYQNKKLSSLPKIQLMVYAGTHQDIMQMVSDLAEKYKINYHMPKLKDPAKCVINANLYQNNEEDQQTFKKIERAPLTILYHPQIIDANALLIRFAFPWADGFITKPSGDMAYDAVAAGCFLLTLAEWGEWEKNIREIFEQKNIARKAQVENILAQLKTLTNSHGQAQSWIEQAMNNAFSIDKLFLNGAKEIIKVATSPF